MQAKDTPRVGVVGAGPAGMTAAYELAKSGVPVDVYEAGDAVGGLARSLRLWNQTVDCGPHRFFSQERRVNELWLELMGADHRMVDRLTRIYYDGAFFLYPLRPFNALSKLGPVEAARCLASFAREQVWPATQGDNFESWVTRRFGSRLFEIFFKSYSEKLWGIPCRELDSDFAAQRIKKLSLFGAVLNALTRGKDNEHATLVDRFAYPTGGTGMVYERMADFVAGNAGHVHLNSPVARVVVDNGCARGIELADGSVQEYDDVISCMPLPLLIASMPDVPEPVRRSAESLGFRNTVLVYLKVEGKDLFPDQWLYVHSPELETGRITNFRNWVPTLYGDEASSILVLEYWAYETDALWSEDPGSLIERAKKELRRTGLIGDTSISDGHVVRIPHAYPVYRAGYKEALKPVEDHLGTIQRLQAAGRGGVFRYNNQDHSMLMGMLAAENITQNAGHDLWKVNTDYDSYQEGADITEAGLGPSPIIE